MIVLETIRRKFLKRNIKKDTPVKSNLIETFFYTMSEIKI